MILLNRTYKGHLAGTVAQFATQEEQAIVTNGLGSISAGPVTPGNINTTAVMGRVGIAAAGTSVTITNWVFTTESRFGVALSNAAADTTAVSVSRIVPAQGSVTFFLNAAATAAVALDWYLVMISGHLQPN
jgi:hypothetical protein